MNRQNFIGHAALAVALVLLAAFAGQLRRMQESHHEGTAETTGVLVLEPRDAGEPAAYDAGGDAEVIVRFREGTSPETIRSIASRLNDRLLDRFEFVGDQAVIADEDNLDAEAVAAEYRELPEVEYAEPNIEIELDPAENDPFDEAADADDDEPPVIMSACAGAKGERPNDPMFGEQWSLDNTGQSGGAAGADICAMGAWSKTTGSRRVIVAVLDTGVDYTHRDLAGNMWKRPASLGPYVDEHLGTIDDLHGYDAADNDGDPRDDNGHGTHCAGIVGAEGGNSEGIAGVNWQVEIMPLKFMDGRGRGTTKDAIEAINYVVARKRAGVNVRVISASWGSTFYSRALEDAIRRAGDEGVLFIAAAGNSSTNNDRRQHYPSGYKLPNVISVAALTRHDALASFSNYGPKTVHVAAPGAQILSTWPGNQYEEHSGTSMATPGVAGVAALVVAAEPGISMEKLRERLLASVDPLPALAGKTLTGGRLNASRAVRAE
ncbi:MAG TPA: S8 family serine peptidase [Pyrinomonadaceae bacterium]|nr:S8 family serine peptidase [Pyrinomonadaceae bacterium]